MRILIGIDGSTGSFLAVQQVGQLLNGTADEVLFYFAPPTIEFAADAISPEVLRKAQDALTQAVFAEAAEKLPETLRNKTELIVGQADPRSEIIELSQTRGVDLIALGARGLGQLESLMLGSVSRAIVQNSRLPVLVARQPGSISQEEVHVLVASDGTQRDDAIAKVLSKIAWPVGTRGTCCTVIEPMFALKTPSWLAKRARSAEVEAMAKAWRDEHEADKSKRQRELLAWCEKLPAAFRQSPLVLEGHAAEQIVAAAKQQAAQLVVVGAFSDASLVSYLLGSTTSAVLAYAPCSVLVVPL